MQISDLFDFVVLAQSPDFSAAAKELRTTRPNLTKRLNSLENEFGVTLIDKSVKSHIELTEIGKKVFSGARQMQALYDDAMRVCSKISSSEESSLFIQTPPILDTLGDVVYKSIQRFKQDHRLTKVNMVFANDKSNELVKNDSIDIGFTVDVKPLEYIQRHAEKHGLIFIPVVSEPLYLWLNKDHPLAGKSSIKLEELVDIPISMMAARRFDAIRFAIEDLFKPLRTLPLFRSYSANDIEEFFSNNSDPASAFIVCDSVSHHPILTMHSNMKSIPIEDENALLTSYFMVKESYSNKAIDEFLDAVDYTIGNDIVRSGEFKFYTSGKSE